MNFNIRFRRFIAKYFGHFVELMYEIKFKVIRFKEPPVIILTPGKVGSSSVYNTLKKELPNHVFHIHNLSKQGIEKSIKDHINSDRKSKPLHLIISNILRNKLSKYQGKLLIITIIREPISREISSFFQNTEFYKDLLENKQLDIDKEVACDMLCEKFESDICKNLKDWFDLEIYNNFGIDVFSKKFDYRSKYDISHNKRYHLLLLKMEDLNAVFPQAIMNFLNLNEPLHLKNVNIADKKHYAKTYEFIKRNIKLDTKTINQIVDSTFFQHFYMEDNSNVIDKWTRK